MASLRKAGSSPRTPLQTGRLVRSRIEEQPVCLHCVQLLVGRNVHLTVVPASVPVTTLPK
jgi:hypothetical protein